MEKSDVGFACSAAGAAMMVAGAAGYTEAWVFLGAGAVLALGGLATVGRRGSSLLLLCGAWVAASTGTGWAAGAWNLMAAGIVAVGLGFTVGVASIRVRPGDGAE